MTDDRLDDEAPPEIPDISSEPEVAPIPALPSELPPPPPPPAGAPAPAKADSDIEVDVDVDLDAGLPSEPGEEVDPEEIPPLPPPRKRMDTHPATPVARASMPPPPSAAAQVPGAAPEALDDLDEPTTRISDVEVESDLEKTLERAPSVLDEADLEEPTVRRPDEPGELVDAPPPAPAPPRPVSQPPRPVSQPPRPVSQPPRPVSQPPRPASQSPPAPAAVAAAHETAASTAPRHDSEPPTQPWNAPPEPPVDAEHAATSYPPPPMTAVEPEERHEGPPPVSLKPMRVIGVARHSDPPAAVSNAAALPPVAAAPVPAEASTRTAGSEALPAEPAESAPVEPSASAARGSELSAERGQEAPGAREAPRAEVPPPPPPPPPAVASMDAAEELSDEDFAPTSSESGDESDISFPVDEVAAEGADEELTDEDIDVRVDRESEPEIAVEVEERKPAPPPPPRREPPRPPSVAEAKEAQRTKQRKAWWEELFGEDFARANTKLKAAQVVREADFIEESLGVAKGGVLLDLCCGGGQHAVELAQRGYGVVGYDLSLYQLSVAADCAQEYGQKLNLLQGDMRELAFEEMFDGIYCWNTSFGYFEEEKNAAVAQRIFRALRPGGMFLLDVANRDFVVSHQPQQTWFEGDACVCMDDMHVDFITSRLKVKRSLILDDGRTLECSYSIRLYSLHELGKILHDVGFRVTEASGHPSTPGVFFGASSPRILILAQRP